jgi:steroid 5-alpha reductase family enzyme
MSRMAAWPTGRARETSLAFGLLGWGALTLYWVAPWLLTSRAVQVPPWYLGGCVTLYVLGICFHFGADMQKHTALALRPDTLITDGMFSRCRNINYFGELLIYLGFGLLAMHWLPIAVLMLYVGAYWIPRMLAKDRSLSRYPEFAEYRRRTKLFLPFPL